MRVLIWVDMEGITGISTWAQVTPGNPLYDEGRILMTGDVNAAVRGAKEAGASEIIVVDSHGAGGEFKFKSLLKDRLEAGAEYVFGAPWMRYVEPLQEGCDAAVILGAHAMAGTADGVLCHTVSSANWYNAYINDQRIGETAITAALCGHFDCPIVLVAGDQATERETRDLLGQDPEFITVKTSINRHAIRSLAPEDAHERIRTGMIRALQNRQNIRPWRPATPTSFKVEFMNPEFASGYEGRVDVERIDDRTVVCRGAHFYDVWDKFWDKA